MIPGGDICIQKMKEILLGKRLIMQIIVEYDHRRQKAFRESNYGQERERFYAMIDT